jgi:hypothetical protein
MSSEHVEVLLFDTSFYNTFSATILYDDDDRVTSE